MRQNPRGIVYAWRFWGLILPLWTGFWLTILTPGVLDRILISYLSLGLVSWAISTWKGPLPGVR